MCVQAEVLVCERTFLNVSPTNWTVCLLKYDQAFYNVTMEQERGIRFLKNPPPSFESCV